MLSLTTRRSAALGLAAALLGCEPAREPAAASAPVASQPAASTSAPASAPPPPTAASPDAVMAQARFSARRCHQQGLTRDADLEGKASFQLQINATGVVDHVDLKPSGLTREVTSCIHGVLTRLVFPPPAAGPTTLSGSFTFRNGNREP